MGLEINLLMLINYKKHFLCDNQRYLPTFVVRYCTKNTQETKVLIKRLAFQN